MDQLHFNVTNLGQETISIKERIVTRRATPKDLQDIYHIACSVGKNKKDSAQGFLVDDYSSNPKYFQRKLLQNIFNLEHFYVAEIFGKPVAFLMAYTKSQWMEANEDWNNEIYWRPDFDRSKTDNFILIDKTAMLPHLTGRGIGSKLYELLIKDISNKSIKHIFAETIISPTPNFASLSFRKKQNYTLAGMRYEEYNNQVYTTLVYHKSI